MKMVTEIKNGDEYIDGILVKYVESDCLDEIEKMLADVDEQERLIWNRTIAELD